MRTVPPAKVPPLSRDTLLFWAKHPDLHPLRAASFDPLAPSVSLFPHQVSETKVRDVRCAHVCLVLFVLLCFVFVVFCRFVGVLALFDSFRDAWCFVTTLACAHLIQPSPCVRMLCVCVFMCCFVSSVFAVVSCPPPPRSVWNECTHGLTPAGPEERPPRQAGRKGGDARHPHHRPHVPQRPRARQHARHPPPTHLHRRHPRRPSRGAATAPCPPPAGAARSHRAVPRHASHRAGHRRWCQWRWWVEAGAQQQDAAGCASTRDSGAASRCRHAVVVARAPRGGGAGAGRRAWLSAAPALGCRVPCGRRPAPCRPRLHRAPMLRAGGVDAGAGGGTRGAGAGDGDGGVQRGGAGTAGAAARADVCQGVPGVAGLLPALEDCGGDVWGQDEGCTAQVCGGGGCGGGGGGGGGVVWCGVVWCDCCV